MFPPAIGDRYPHSGSCAQLCAVQLSVGAAVHNLAATARRNACVSVSGHEQVFALHR